jgi:hypothetical protein
MTLSRSNQIIRRDYLRETRRESDFMSLQGVRKAKYLFLNSLFTFVYCCVDFANLNSIYL